MNGAGILTFLALASVFLWFIIAGKGRWWPKLLAILGVVGFAAAIWFSALSFTGWPTHAKPPELSIYMSGFVVEPDSEQDGAIYLWLLSPPESTTIYEYQAKSGEPRAYVLQYSRKMHEQVEAATKATAKGQRVAFSTKGKPEGGKAVGEGEDGGRGRGSGQPGSGGNQGGQQGTAGGAAGFYVLPPAVSVPKG